jgi:hypothetical protein
LGFLDYYYSLDQKYVSQTSFETSSLGLPAYEEFLVGVIKEMARNQAETVAMVVPNHVERCTRK